MCHSAAVHQGSSLSPGERLGQSWIQEAAGCWKIPTCNTWYQSVALGLRCNRVIPVTLGQSTPLGLGIGMAGVTFGEHEEGTPEDAPPMGAARRDLRAALGSLSGAGIEGEPMSPLEEDLRDVRK